MAGGALKAGSGGVHGMESAPSPWVVRWGTVAPAGGSVLDVACGAGRHVRWFAERGHAVLGVDRDPVSAAALAGIANATHLLADLEAAPWPFRGQSFAVVVVTNYLHRPLLPHLVEALAPGGLLIYETFAVGNERFGRPSNPAFLLRPGELLEAVRGDLRVIAYEDLEVAVPRPAMIQRVCARRD